MGKSNDGKQPNDKQKNTSRQKKNKKKKKNPDGQTVDETIAQTVDEESGGDVKKAKSKKEKSKRQKDRKGAATTMQPVTTLLPATTAALPVEGTPPVSGREMTPAGADAAGKNGAPNAPKKVVGKNPITPEVEAAIAHFVKVMLTKGVAGLRKEFAQLKVYTSPNYKFEAFSNPNNTARNRYRDVVCLDSSRVILTLNVPPESDYIHANNIKLDGLDRQYIATQGPLESTIADFWRLVHQEAPSCIVMLCKCIEDGKHKCAQYFPPANEYKNYGCMFVNNKRTENTEDNLFVHSIEALPDGCSNSTTVKLFQMNDWPDRGVPEKPMSILRLLKALPTGRCIIHCSAGVGRTGTVILIDAIISRLLSGLTCNVEEMFHVLRNQRASAVQAESQYVLVHTCVLNYIRAKMPAKYKDTAIQWAEEVKNAKMD